MAADQFGCVVGRVVKALQSRLQLDKFQRGFESLTMQSVFPCFFRFYHLLISFQTFLSLKFYFFKNYFPPEFALPQRRPRPFALALAPMAAALVASPAAAVC
jgi:hypothetical protein